jgi:hypothetical protein
MKNLFSTFKLFTIVLLGAMVLSACNKSQAQPQDQPQDGQETEAPKTEIQSGQQALGSIQTVKNKTDSTCKAQERQSNHKNGPNNQNKEDKRDDSLLTIIAICCSLLALAIAIFTTKKTIAATDRLNRHRNDINSLKNQLSESKAIPIGYSNTLSSKNNTSYDCFKLSKRIDEIERKLNSKQTQPTHKEDNPPIVIDNPVSQKREAYFGTPSQAQGDSAYFKKEFKYHDTEVMFSAVIIEDNAEFRPIEGNTASLGTLKSSDTMKLAVQFEGCAPSEANSMQVILSGIAKFDGERWYIKKKTVVRLIK